MWVIRSFYLKVPTGDYWWSKLCDTMFKSSFNGFLEIERISIWLDTTTHGDGDYFSNKGREYFVRQWYVWYSKT